MTAPTIITQIYGGLGNQMFQYACGRALALRSGGELVLDFRSFVAGLGQEPGLHHLNIVAREAVASELPPAKEQAIRYFLWRTLKLSPRMVRQKELAFDPQVPSLSGSLCLRGYWQSERYFEDVANQIRRELSVKTAADQKNQNLLAEIGASPAVSLHIRRGDYVNNPKTNAVHGTCSLDYYRRAADHVARHMDERPVFYVFSDEPDWAVANLELPFETRVMDHNDSRRNYEDLRLMTACRHHVIANSSFSWWGAWLNPSDHKTVVAPSRWFAEPSMINPDMVPAGWTTLEA
ncbi:MAG: alpha-1,2-fucosyltransferase [Hyphomicrobiales bacterium]|nr:alpha-1,2-fucosyltransferase [Hyphomicrobiales bacterium]